MAPLPQNIRAFTPGNNNALSVLSRLVTFAAAGFELIFEVLSPGISRLFKLCLLISSSFFCCHSGTVSELHCVRLININNKKVLKVIGYRAAVFGTVANNFPLAGDNFYVRTFIKRID